MFSFTSLTMLAQASPVEFDSPASGGFLCAAFGFVLSGMALLYSAFWVWMLIDCIIREPDRFFWIWLLLIVPFPGAVVYAALRFFPQRDFTAPRWMRSWTRGHELSRLETAAQQIGNPHQYIQWGQALREVGRLDQAQSAFAAALRKEPHNLQALWGAALVAVDKHQPAEVKLFCEQILAIDPQYKFGDVSLAYGRALNDLGETAAMRQHLEQHVKRWRHPEAVYLLSLQCQADGDTDAAREHLTAMLRDIQGSPAAIARKFGRWRSRGRRLLRQLPKTASR